MKSMLKQAFNQNIYGITDSSLSLGRPTLEVAEAMLKAGVKIIQYREKDLSLKEKLADCYALRELTKRYAALFIVNDHIDIALLVQADGVHLGQDDIPLQDARKLLGDKIVGISTHSSEQAEQAVLAGADYIGVGPIFSTKTKKDVCQAVGVAYLEHVAKNYKEIIPFVAIGGIKRHNLPELIKAGAYCFALVSEIVGSPDVAQRIKEIRLYAAFCL